MGTTPGRSVGTSCRCLLTDHLTPREVQVLVLAAAGESNAQIAGALLLSARTVDQHLMNMMRRTGSANRNELIARCCAAGILRPGTWPPRWSGRSCPII